MRIALVDQTGSPLTPARDSGKDTQATPASAVTSLASALARLGHRVTVYARADSRGLPGSAILCRGVTVEHMTAGPLAPLTPGELTTHLRAFGDQLAQRWKRSRPDIVHARFWTSGLAALAAARDRNLPVVVSFGSLAASERRHGLTNSQQAARLRLEACIARSASAVLASTSTEAAELIRMGVPRASIALVPHGIDPERFCPDGPVAERNGRPRLLAVTPLADGQGLDVLVGMLPGVPEAELVIVGGPPKTRLRKDKAYQNLRARARELGVQRRVVFTGQVGSRDLPALLRSADLLVSAAPYDPCGEVTIAAMACGTPAATAAVGASRDAVLDEVTGLLVAPGRPGLLARRVRRLLATPMRLEAFGIAAADRARARYSWDRIAQETTAAYERCLPVPDSTPAVAEPEAELARELAAAPA